MEAQHSEQLHKEAIQFSPGAQQATPQYEEQKHGRCHSNIALNKKDRKRENLSITIKSIAHIRKTLSQYDPQSTVSFSLKMKPDALQFVNIHYMYDTTLSGRPR